MIDALLTSIFPKKCIFCGHVLSMSEPINICESCSVQIPYYAGKYLYEDALRAGGASVTAGIYAGGDRCDRIICVCKYTGFIRKTISAYKFYGRNDYGLTLAALLCERLDRTECFINASHGGCGIVTCVPLSRKRLRERGYNQAAILARHASRYFNLPFEGGLLVRDERALRQSTLRRKERRANVQSAFHVNDIKAYKLLKRLRGGHTRQHLLLEGMRVLLIDDIATSMSTINACAAALKAQGAAEVVGAVLAAPF
jgi:ComF family protein